MPALCDVNVLLALVADRHALHDLAVRWAESLPAGGAVLCRVTQMGLLRLLNNPAVMREEALDTGHCWSVWRRVLEDERFRFASDEPPGLDVAFERFTTGRAFSPRLWTDAYLAGLRAGDATYARDVRQRLPRYSGAELRRARTPAPMIVMFWQTRLPKS